MNLDDQLQRYFGTSALDGLSQEAPSAGADRMKVDLGLATDRNLRFAIWALLEVLGEAPDLDVTFPDEEDREAARNFMDVLFSNPSEQP